MWLRYAKGEVFLSHSQKGTMMVVPYQRKVFEILEAQAKAENRRRFKYPRWVTRKSEPYDPVEVARITEGVVCKSVRTTMGSSIYLRKYTNFYVAKTYGRAANAYTVGCCLRCIFCSVEKSRDFPERYGVFYTPRDVVQRLLRLAEERDTDKLKISGGEPTIGKEHLLSVLDLLSGADCQFILETNGVLLGASADYIATLRRYENLHVRVSLKAGNAQGFEERTGALGEYYILPFMAIKNLMDAGVDFHVASMSDPEIMHGEERLDMLKELKNVGYKKDIEEEKFIPYDTTMVRLRAAGR
ncbi:MAG: 7-carboxy-7-deazaguanine synthase [Candidatus Scalindua rubra]|uniref:7-carboxy-7-deazaguanine synthase n=1 Tax=Candidatus Scalindua rubra TaxID=1872076 RepID=A0A1E3XD04_9BACT|nr:MAG: 7-carboxy-7-deazaguanine synthase [Candidatus Scalindua rubra]